MKKLKNFLTNKFGKIAIFLLISSFSFSGQYKTALINRMNNIRNKVFENVDEGNDYQEKEALRKMEEEWDRELNIVYQKIMKIADSKTKNKLKNVQRAWIKFRDAETEKSYYTNNPTGGSMGVLFSINTAVQLTEERTLQLAEMYDALNN